MIRISPMLYEWLAATTGIGFVATPGRLATPRFSVGVIVDQMVGDIFQIENGLVERFDIRGV
jgi:hypothetical protein